MFGLPFVGGLMGGLIGNLLNHNHCHNHHGHHHNHGHHHHGNLGAAAQDFRMAREDFRDAQRDFAQGNFFGGIQELSEANQHVADGYSHLNSRGWV